MATARDSWFTSDLDTDARIAHEERVGRQMVAIEDDREVLTDILARQDLDWLTSALVAAINTGKRDAFWATVHEVMDPLIRERAEQILSKHNDANAEAASECAGWAREEAA